MSIDGGPRPGTDDPQAASGDDGPLLAFADVPAAGRDAEPDPYWQELQGDPLLPVAYMPPAMGGEHPAWMRLSVWMLISVFVTATSLGVCLTYWPGL